MRNFNLSPALQFSLLWVLACLAFGQSAEEILDKASEAVGGKKAMENISSMIIQGKVSIPPGIEAKMTILQKSGGKILVTTKVAAPGIQMEIVQGCNGTDCYSNDPNMGLRQLEGQEKEMMLVQNDFMAQAEWRLLYSKTEFRGKGELDGRPVFHIYLETLEGMTMTNSYDTESYMLLKSEGATQSVLGNLKFSTTFHDYREHEGLKLPMRTKTSMMGQSMEMTLEEIEINVNIPDSKFKLPEGIGSD